MTVEGSGADKTCQVLNLVTKKPPVVRAALCICLGVCYFLTLTGAILTENRSLIIRTAIRMTIREREKVAFIWLWVFRPIIGRNGNKSRGNCRIRRSHAGHQRKQTKHSCFFTDPWQSRIQTKGFEASIYNAPPSSVILVRRSFPFPLLPPTDFDSTAGCSD